MHQPFFLEAERDHIETSIISSTQEREHLQTDDVQKPLPDACLSENQVERVQTDELDQADVQNGRLMSPGTLALMCDEQDSIFMVRGSPDGVVGSSQIPTVKSSHGQACTEVYVEQERLVLTKFWDFLNRLITCGSIKGNVYFSYETLNYYSLLNVKSQFQFPVNVFYSSKLFNHVNEIC